MRRGTLTARGAAGVRNALTARRRGPNWVVTDKLAPLRAGRRCKRVAARRVICAARRVKRIRLYGGAGNDRLTVVGRIPVRFFGGPGIDRTRRRSR